MYNFNKSQEKWLEALESGEYKRCTSQLCEVNIKTGEEKYCCLGVACELMVGKKKQYRDEDSSIKSYDGEECFLPGYVAKKLRFKENSQQELTCMNDNGKTFKQIAKYIRNNPEKVFN